MVLSAAAAAARKIPRAICTGRWLVRAAGSRNRHRPEPGGARPGSITRSSTKAPAWWSRVVCIAASSVMKKTSLGRQRRQHGGVACNLAEQQQHWPARDVREGRQRLQAGTGHRIRGARRDHQRIPRSQAAPAQPHAESQRTPCPAGRTGMAMGNRASASRSARRWPAAPSTRVSAIGPDYEGTTVQSAKTFKVAITYGGEQAPLGRSQGAPQAIESASSPSSDPTQHFAWFHQLEPGQALGTPAQIWCRAHPQGPTGARSGTMSVAKDAAKGVVERVAKPATTHAAKHGATTHAAKAIRCGPCLARPCWLWPAAARS